MFFTPARNVISPYPLPALPALALIPVEISWRRSNAEDYPNRLNELPAEIQARLTKVGTFADESTLYVEQGATPAGQ